MNIFTTRIISPSVAAKPASVGKLLLTLVLALSMAGVANAEQTPDVVVKQTVDQLVNNIQTNRAVYAADTDALYAMVENTLVPSIHVQRMSNLILGKNARRASNEQKAAFAQEFKTFLIRSYATALLEYTGNEKVKYKPVKIEPGADKVAVKAELIASDGQAYPINLYMSNRKDTRWRAYNMEVAGINFVSTYRATFGEIVAKKGVDGLVADLRQKNQKLGS